jgi:outer membrane immunogenic protein
MQHKGVIMRKVVIGILAAGIMGVGAASAADLPQKAPAFIPAPAPVLSWAGFYIGGNIGYGFGTAEATQGRVTASEEIDGIVGGAQIGYNFQWGSPFVLGIEADIQGTDQSRETAVGTNLGRVTFRDQLTWFGTVRARLGYAPGPWLFYVTGGLAYGEFDSDVTFRGVTTTLASEIRTGWTVGGGVEWMFAPQWSAKLEYLYIDTGDFDTTVPGLGPVTARLTDNVVRVGVNYHF